MLYLKEGVRAGGLRPEMAIVRQIATEVYAEHGADLTITSIADGVHAATSKHYVGCAEDYRTHHGVLPDDETRYEVAAEIQRRVGAEFWVRYEPDKWHIHAQWNGSHD